MTAHDNINICWQWADILHGHPPTAEQP